MKQKPKDKQLDVPSVANEEKHINFLADDKSADANISKEDKERKQKWEEGIREGEDETRDEPHFQKRDLNEDEEY